MGMGPVQCMLGFSTIYTNELSERLERRAAELDHSFRNAQSALLGGLSSLHESVDSALCNDGAKTACSLNRGLGELATCNELLSGMVATLTGARSDFAKCQEANPGDPLNQRDRFFSLIDCDQLYRDLETRGAALPGRVLWDEAVSAIQSGGTQGALQLLESQVTNLQADLSKYIHEVETMRSLPVEALPHSLHDTTLSVSALVMGLVRFLTSCTYVSIVCGHAMDLCERDLALAVAVA